MHIRGIYATMIMRINPYFPVELDKVNGLVGAYGIDGKGSFLFLF